MNKSGSCFCKTQGTSSVKSNKEPACGGFCRSSSVTSFSSCFTRLSMMRTTTAKATTTATAMNARRSPGRAAIPLSSRSLLKTRVALSVEKIALRLPVVLRATAVQPSDPAAELFATLSSVAVDGENDVRPAVAFTSSSSSSSPSTSGRGLVATRPLARGEVALRVPGSICLVVDYSPRGSGLSLPQSER